MLANSQHISFGDFFWKNKKQCGGVKLQCTNGFDLPGLALYKQMHAWAKAGDCFHRQGNHSTWSHMSFRFSELLYAKVSASMTDELPWQQQGHFKIRKQLKFHLLSTVWLGSFFKILISNSLPWLLRRRNSAQDTVSLSGELSSFMREVMDFGGTGTFCVDFHLVYYSWAVTPQTRECNCFSKTKWEHLRHKLVILSI